MDVYSLKNYIINHPEYIELILEQTGFHNITNNKRKHEYRCSRDEGRNPTSVRVDKQTLAATCFSTNLNGDLITLVQDKLHTSFPQTVRKIADIIDFKDQKKIEEYSPPFGGFYKKIAKLKNDDEIDLETYSDNILEQYGKYPSLLFYEDGILPQVQMDYGIGYDSVSRRISVPWYTFDYQLCGIMGRLNKKHVDDYESKWMPIIPFQKSKTLFAYSRNYNSIIEKSFVIIGESEKMPLQLASMGLNVGIGLGGSFISEVQANHVKSLFPKTILVGMDEGLLQEHSVEIAKQLKMNSYYKNSVGYLFDKDNMYLPKGSKLSPSDLDKNTLKQLIKNCIVWI